MDLRQLRHFTAIFESRSYSVAARELGMTQPALTRSVRDLERAAGAPLLVRGRTGTVPTPAGLQFYQRARRILNDCERAQQELATIRTGGVGRVCIGVGGSYVETVVCEVVARSTAEMPALDLEVVEGLIEDLLEPLLDGRIDVIFTTFAPPVMRDGIVTEPLLDVAPVVVAAASHPLVGRDDLSLADLRQSEWVNVDQATKLEMFDRLFTAARLSPPRPVRVGSLELIKRLVASGRFLTLLPARAVNAELRNGTFRRLPISTKGLPAEGGLIYIDRRVRTAATSRVMELMRTVCAVRRS
jgi:DNA-binding transcriptional LysR family regulator